MSDDFSASIAAVGEALALIDKNITLLLQPGTDPTQSEAIFAETDATIESTKRKLAVLRESVSNQSDGDVESTGGPSHQERVQMVKGYMASMVQNVKDYEDIKAEIKTFLRRNASAPSAPGAAYAAVPAFDIETGDNNEPAIATLVEQQPQQPFVVYATLFTGQNDTLFQPDPSVAALVAWPVNYSTFRQQSYFFPEPSAPEKEDEIAPAPAPERKPLFTDEDKKNPIKLVLKSVFYLIAIPLYAVYYILSLKWLYSCCSWTCDMLATAVTWFCKVTEFIFVNIFRVLYHLVAFPLFTYVFQPLYWIVFRPLLQALEFVFHFFVALLEFVFITVPYWIYKNILVHVFYIFIELFKIIWDVTFGVIIYHFIIPGVKLLHQAVMAIYESIILPVYRFIVSIPSKVYQYVILPVTTAIMAVWKMFYDNVIMPIYNHVLLPVGRFIAAIPGWIYQNLLVPVGQCVAAVFKFIYDYIIMPIYRVLSAIWNAIVAVWTAVYNAIAAVFTAIYNALAAVFSAIGRVLSTIFSAIGRVLSAIFEAIVKVFTTIFTAIGNAISTVASAIHKYILSPIWSVITAVASAIWNVMVAVGTAIQTALNAVYTHVLTPIFNAIGAVFAAIGAVMARIAEAIRSAVRSVTAFFR